MIALRGAERTVERWTDELTHWAHLASRSTAALAGLGLFFLVFLGGVVTLIIMSFSGAFSSDASVGAQLPPTGAAVALNSQVDYRDVTVGKVATTPVGQPDGHVRVVLHIKPSMLHSIPANVTANVAPISIFGNEYVVLEPPTGQPSGSLQGGQTIPAVSQATASVQTTLASLDYLLTQLHPAQLYSALSALAGSLQGQGTSLGTTLTKFDTYLHNMLPLWPKVVSDFNLLAPVSNQLTASAPNILSAIANFSATSQTITTQQLSIDQLLSGATTFSNETTGLLRDIQQPYSELVASAGPFLQSLSQTPTTIAEILHGLDAFAQTWLTAEANNRYLTLSANVSVHNVADLALAALGGPNVAALLSDALGPSFVNPPTYTAANCPRYGSLVGRGCAGGTAAVQPVSILSQPAQQNAVADITAGLDGGIPPASPAVSTLLLSPVLDHMVSS